VTGDFIWLQLHNRRDCLGKNWDAAHAVAEEFAVNNPDAFMVHPFNQESTWRGHATVVGEIHQQMMEMREEEKPAAIVTCVGGGGLAIGNVYTQNSISTQIHYLTQGYCSVWILLVGRMFLW